MPAENTIAAFDYAMANGCDGFEFDVRHTHDDSHVLCHDPKHNGKELATTDFSGFGESLPCLDEVLNHFATAYLDIELKASGNEEAVAAALHANPPRRGYIVSSFLPSVLLRLHEIDPSLPLGYICKVPEEAKRWTELPVSAFVPHRSLVSLPLIEEVHAQGLKLLTWTVNQQRELIRLADWGVDGLISDDPKLLVQTFPSAMAIGT